MVCPKIHDARCKSEAAAPVWLLLSWRALVMQMRVLLEEISYLGCIHQTATVYFIFKSSKLAMCPVRNGSVASFSTVDGWSRRLAILEVGCGFSSRFIQNGKAKMGVNMQFKSVKVCSICRLRCTCTADTDRRCTCTCTCTSNKHPTDTHDSICLCTTCDRPCFEHRALCLVPTQLRRGSRHLITFVALSLPSLLPPVG